jgi:uncharacterized protein
MKRISLFDDAPKALIDKIELVVRLIRSKGVGVFFVTQNPIDIPDKVLGQLGNRVQHAIRAYTPKDQKAITAMAETFRQNPAIDIPSTITELRTGEALVSLLDEEGRPSIVQRAMILPPHSIIGTITPQKREELISNSPFFYKYHQIVDKETAYEILKAKVAQHQAAIAAQALEKEKAAAAKLAEKEALQREKEAARLAKQQAKSKPASSELQKMTKITVGHLKQFRRSRNSPQYLWDIDQAALILRQITSKL